jgi:predicted lysophospholipase L1 biosynthesis ABC-type transport system permease subunit
MSGRFFAPDEHAQNRRVAIVNDRLAAQVWPNQDAIGKRLKWGTLDSPSPWLTVVGVVRSVADGPLGTDPKVHAYEPFRQLPDFFLNGATNQFGRDLRAAILTDGDPRHLASLVRETVGRVDAQLAIDSIEPMDDQVRDTIAPQRFSTLLVATFAGIALLLATIGLYGLIAFTTAERQKEIALRVALGAERGAVVRMVIGQGARLVGLGLVAGLLLSLALTRTVAALLYQSNPYDMVAFALIPAVLGPVALAACALPAWRAARIDPTAALRAD